MIRTCTHCVENLLGYRPAPKDLTHYRGTQSMQLYYNNVFSNNIFSLITLLYLQGNTRSTARTADFFSFSCAC